MRKPPILLVVPCAVFIASALLMYTWVCWEIEVLEVDMELWQRDLPCFMKMSDEAAYPRTVKEIVIGSEIERVALKVREEKLVQLYGIYRNILWLSLIPAALAYCFAANKKSLRAVGLVLCLVFAILGVVRGF